VTVYKACAVEGTRSSSKRDSATGALLRPPCDHKPPRGCRWAFVVDLPSGADGKRRQHREQTFSTKGAAEEAQRALLSRVDRGESLGDRGRTVEAELRAALRGNRDLKATTRAGYEAHLTNYILPALGGLRLDKLRTSHVDEMVRAIERGELGPRDAVGLRLPPPGPATIQRIRATLRCLLAGAVKERRLPYNPATNARLPKVRRAEVQPWEAAQLGRFLDEAGSERLGIMFEVIATTGLRRAEACGARWCDLDLERGLLRVVQTLVAVPAYTDPVTGARVGRATRIETPKSQQSTRTVDLDGRTVGALLGWGLAQSAERAAWGLAYVTDYAADLAGDRLPDCTRDGCTHGLLFSREDGAHVRPDWVSQRLTVIAKRAGLPAKRLHDLRHGAASLQLAAGIPLAVVSKRLGHSTVALTGNTYSHLLEGTGRAAAEATQSLIPRRPRDTGVSLGTETASQPTSSEVLASLQAQVRAEGVGFEPTETQDASAVFKTAAIGH